MPLVPIEQPIFKKMPCHYQGKSIMGNRSFDATKDLTKLILSKNLGKWLKRLNYRSYRNQAKDVIKKYKVMSIPATHTFGVYKIWGDREGENKNLCDEIIHKRGALLSNYSQARAGCFYPSEPRPQMGKAKKVKLDHFVFAYLGVHDPYYARSWHKKNPIPAIGVFLKTNLEIFPKCNATRRDLNAEDAEFPPDNEFLLPKHARMLAAYQTICDRKHKGDFWHYWGSTKYSKRQNYLDNHWQWKIEFHYRDRISIEEFDAILWPFEYEYVIENGEIKQYILEESEYEYLQEEANKDCQIIPYNWNFEDPIGTFMKASEATVKYWIKNGKYPEDSDEAFKILEVSFIVRVLRKLGIMKS